MIQQSSLNETDTKMIGEAVRRPMLNKEEELELFRRYQKEGDQRALDRLMLSYEKLAVKVARFYYASGRMEFQDLLQEAKIGLMTAMKRYDPDRGVAFATMALIWVRAAVQEFIVRNTTSVTLPRSHGARAMILIGQQKRREAIANLEAQGNEDPSDSDIYMEVARLAGVKEKTAGQMALALASAKYSLDAPVSAEDQTSLQELTPANAPDPEEEVFEKLNEENIRKLTHSLLDRLNPRAQHVVLGRFGFNSKVKLLSELGKDLNVSSERVRQIEARSIEQLRQFMKKNRELKQAVVMD